MELRLQSSQIQELLGMRAYVLGMRLREFCDFRDIDFQFKECTTLAVGVVDATKVAVEMKAQSGVPEFRIFCTSCARLESCEHIGAFMLELAHEYSDEFVVSDDPTARPGATRPIWYRALSKIVPAPPHHDDQDLEPLALLLSITTPTGSGWGITVRARPLRLGVRGGWIQSGVSWNHLFHDQRFDRQQAQALTGLYELQRNSQYYYQNDDAWLILSNIPGKALLDAFRKIFAAGVPIVDDSTGRRTIPVRTEELTPLIDLKQTEQGLVLRAEPLGVPSEVWDIEGIGRDAQLVVLTRGAKAPKPERSLAILKSPLTQELQQLSRQGTIEIPAADIAQFETSMLGRLRRVATLASSDQSYPIPEASRPVLSIGLRQEIAGLRVSFAWKYTRGSDRDRTVERGILSAIGDNLGEHAKLLGAPINGNFVEQVMSAGQILDFMIHALPLLREHPDVQVREESSLPAYRMSQQLPQVNVKVAQGTNDWFDLAVSVTLEGEEVPFAELFTALNTEEPYMLLPSGTVLNLAANQFAQLRTLISEAAELAEVRPDGVRMHRLSIDWWQELLALGIIEAQENDWLHRMNQLGSGEKLQPLTSSPDFTPTLRDYQVHGSAWLHFLRTHGLGGVLADDMGLGKTVQLLAALDVAHVENPKQKYLVVAPTSVAGNWAAEAARFVPHIRTKLLGETSKKRGTSVANEATDAELLITSYAVFRLDFESFDELDYAVLILDEAQQLKNHTSKGYKQARQMEVPSKFVVTGTPVENNLVELWALVSLAAPGLLGGLKSFKENYAKPVDEGDTERLNRLKSRLRPFVLRRTKEQVATDLPTKTEQVLQVELDPVHRKAYDRRFQRVRQEILGLVEDVDSNRFKILQSLTLLRQLALDPSLVDEGNAPSAKLEMLERMLEDAVAEGHKVLVFSQFTGFLSKARDLAVGLGLQVGYLDGGTSQPRRRTMIDEFSEGKFPVFFISLKAGGFGINLTAADYCILLDPWWNPAAEAQAVDRTHRIGQEKPVFVYRLVARDTIEAKVVALQERKTRLFNDVLGEQGDAAQASVLGAEDFLELLR